MDTSSSAQELRAGNGQTFASLLVEPYVPDIERINASVEEVRTQQKKLVKQIADAKAELKWCGSGELGQLEATMDLVPHYTFKAQQCVRDMHALRARVAKAKDKTMKLIRATEKRKK